MELQKVYSSLYKHFLKIQKNGPRMVHAGNFFDCIRRGPCEDLSTWISFDMALTVTFATVGIVAKSMQRPREVHFFTFIKWTFLFSSRVPTWKVVWGVQEVRKRFFQHV